MKISSQNRQRMIKHFTLTIIRLHDDSLRADLFDRLSIEAEREVARTIDIFLAGVYLVNGAIDVINKAGPAVTAADLALHFVDKSDFYYLEEDIHKIIDTLINAGAIKTYSFCLNDGGWLSLDFG
tara:strand:- start:439 stop:813 length:375 start_codon:yes stop_codon:yes gene_type:complete